MNIDAVLCLAPLAFLLDLLIGDPEYPFHPVRIIGNYIIAPLESLLRRVKLDGKGGGFILMVVTLAVPTGFVLSMNALLKPYPIPYYLFNLYVLYTCIAVKDLSDHAVRVIDVLKEGDLEEARRRVAFIVSRETQSLDEEGVSRSCIETLAENLSDGIIGPLFYIFLGGAPAAIFYKAASTMDSMLGYKNERYKHFGFFPAKFDDVMNFIPARMSMVMILLAGYFYAKDWDKAWRTAFSDRFNHSSPNSAHPEAAMAGVLDLRLGGPNIYHGRLVEKPYINGGGKPCSVSDIGKVWKITFIVSVLTLLTLTLIRLVIINMK